MMQETLWRIKQSGHVKSVLNWWYANPRIRFLILQWLIVIIVSILLSGNVLLMVSSSGLLRAALLLMLTIAGLGVLLTGSTGYLERLLIAAIMMDIPFQLDLNPGFDQRVARFGAISGFNISLTLVGLIALYTLWAISILSKRTSPPSKSFFRLSLPLLVYFAVVSLSTLVAGNMELSILEINLLLQATLLYFYIAYMTRTRKDLLFIITVLFVGLVLFSFFTIYLSIIGGFEQGAASANSAVTRFGGGSLGQPNVAASYLMMVLLLIFSCLTVPQIGRWFRRLAALAVGLGGIALLATGSRGGWGGFAIAITLFCWLAWREGWLSLKVPAAYFTVAFLTIAPFYQAILNRLGSEAATASANARDPLNQLALRMVWDQPLFGVGANNFAYNLPRYVTSEFANAWIDTVHNKYLLVWAETGVVGLAAFLWFLLSILYLGWQVWQQRDRFLSLFALAFTLAITAAMIHMTVAQYHSRVQFQLIWLMAGVIVAMYRMERGHIEDS